MALLVDDADKAPVLRHGVHRRGHVVQEEVGADHGDELPVAIDRERAHNADLTGEQVGGHVRIVQLSGLHRPGVPQALPHGDGDEVAAFVKL